MGKRWCAALLCAVLACSMTGCGDFLDSGRLFGIRTLLDRGGLRRGLGLRGDVLPDGDRVLTGAHRLLHTGIVLNHVHAERVERADGIILVHQRVHDNQILVLSLIHISEPTRH